MAILVAADFDDAAWAIWWACLQAALPGEQLVRDRSACGAEAIDIAIVANPPPLALQGLPALRLIQSLWAGVDGLLADASLPIDVPLARMVDPAMDTAMAETVRWAVLGLQRGFFGYAEQQRARRWQALPWRRADELCVAVLGLGQMGRASALALVSQGCVVSGWSRSPRAVAGVRTRAGPAGLAEVLAEADIVVNLLPLTLETRGLFDAATFARMPRGAGFINLARGAQVVEADLLAALASGQIRHAVLDVFAVEPLPPAHPFWAHAQVTVLPHIAAPTDPRSAARVVACNVQALRAGQPLAALVDRARGY